MHQFGLGLHPLINRASDLAGNIVVVVGNCAGFLEVQPDGFEEVGVDALGGPREAAGVGQPLVGIPLVCRGFIHARHRKAKREAR